uniref:Uncharacterized protein n=1 Tax=Heliothis virescens TaxID=7102 RepID=A0A2A4K6I8_HELVI
MAWVDSTGLTKDQADPQQHPLQLLNPTEEIPLSSFLRTVPQRHLLLPPEPPQATKEDEEAKEQDTDHTALKDLTVSSMDQVDLDQTQTHKLQQALDNNTDQAIFTDLTVLMHMAQTQQLQQQQEMVMEYKADLMDFMDRVTSKDLTALTEHKVSTVPVQDQEQLQEQPQQPHLETDTEHLMAWVDSTGPTKDQADPQQHPLQLLNPTEEIPLSSFLRTVPQRHLLLPPEHLPVAKEQDTGHTALKDLTDSSMGQVQLKQQLKQQQKQPQKQPLTQQ